MRRCRGWAGVTSRRGRWCSGWWWSAHAGLLLQPLAPTLLALLPLLALLLGYSNIFATGMISTSASPATPSGSFSIWRSAASSASGFLGELPCASFW